MTRSPFPRMTAPRRALAPLVGALLAVVVALLAGAGGARAASSAPAAPVPQNFVSPLGAVQPAVVVPYRQLIGVADARNLNAAVVDTSSY